jgi:hypothetical protein
MTDQPIAGPSKVSHNNARGAIGENGEDDGMVPHDSNAERKSRLRAGEGT